ncbi:MAG: fumarylacetoacetate hydrolase family protein [Bacteroidetes bacterium]|nr:fumarylacetoacetate hydrolase family protein [Bacteroidota bacterium]MDA1119754.1 fumarylacetoacetate hydrolase family protein [Bacteroidota bacterium]
MSNYKIYRCPDQIVIYNDSQYSVTNIQWDDLINRKGLNDFISENLNDWAVINEATFNSNEILAPIGHQELWASGVTYMRSKEARMEESKKSHGDYFYEKVYDADRPELFFKAAAHRVVGPNDIVNIRRDSTWNVPEPELTLFISSQATIEGYTIGNDMSSRSIEGENPLYLPQAKSYDRSAAMGPCLYVPSLPLELESKIELIITRNGAEVFQGAIAINQMKRQLQELVDYLFLECSFEYGCYLMTGTGIIPHDDFTLYPGDEVRISIENIGTLINTVGIRAI